MDEKLIQKTRTYVETSLSGAEDGHGFLHAEHVERVAVAIAEKEGGVDMTIVRCGALLHDIADSKFHDGDEEIGPQTSYSFLKSVGAPENVCEHVANIVRYISFKGSLDRQKWMSPELAVVQDADRLTGMGAIGIARTFNYGGNKGRAIYDPAVKPNLNMSKEEYKNSTGHTINHFYEKLLLLKDLMNTPTGREMATIRHNRMKTFLKEFYEEWDGLQ